MSLRVWCTCGEVGPLSPSSSLPPLTLGLWAWLVGGARKQGSLRMENSFFGRFVISFFHFFLPFSLLHCLLGPLFLLCTVISVAGQCCCYDAGTTPKEPCPGPPGDDNEANYRGILCLYQEGGQWRHVLRLFNRFGKPVYGYVYTIHLSFSDKGILMTFGSGVNGCLGYGNYDDAPEVNIYTCVYTHDLHRLLHVCDNYTPPSQSWFLRCWTLRVWGLTVDRPTWSLSQVLFYGSFAV